MRLVATVDVFLKSATGCLPPPPRRPPPALPPAPPPPAASGGKEKGGGGCRKSTTTDKAAAAAEKGGKGGKNGGGGRGSRESSDRGSGDVDDDAGGGGGGPTRVCAVWDGVVLHETEPVNGLVIAPASTVGAGAGGAAGREIDARWHEGFDVHLPLGVSASAAGAAAGARSISHPPGVRARR